MISLLSSKSTNNNWHNFHLLFNATLANPLNPLLAISAKFFNDFGLPGNSE
jgi:hypothetical protein